MTFYYATNTLKQRRGTIVLLIVMTMVMYENASYGGWKRCKSCTVLIRLREKDASPDRVSVGWQSGVWQSGVLEVLIWVAEEFHPSKVVKS